MASGLVSDEVLIAHVRSGDVDAFGELFSRHRKVANKVAMAHGVRRSSVDDVVADAFARVLSALRNGGGPTIAFRPYLLTCVRRVAIDAHRGIERELSVDEFGDAELRFDPLDESAAEVERSLAARAFRSLPERWRAVLWYSEIERMKPGAFAPLMGLTPNAAAALAVRAREGLRDAYIQAHLETDVAAGCQSTVDRLGQYLRGSLATRDHNNVDAHLDSCGRCSALYLELRDSTGHLRGIFAIVIFGAGAVGAKWFFAATASRYIRSASPKVQAAVAGATAVAVVAAVVAIRTPPDKSPVRLASKATTLSNDRVPTPGQPDLIPAIATTGTTAVHPTPGSAPSTSSTIPPSSTAGPVATTSGPTTTTTGATTVVANGTTTTSTPPQPDSGIGASYAATGDLVAGQPGAVAIDVSTAGSGFADQVRLHVSVTASIAVTAVDAPGWACVMSSGTADCTTSSLKPLSHALLYILVAVNRGQQTRVDAVVSTSSPDANSQDNAFHQSIPILPSGFSARFVRRQAGTVLSVGNSMRTCPSTVNGCLAAQQGLGPLSALSNNRWAMQAVDSDTDPSTTSSSSATLSLPPGATVSFAALYWGGTLRGVAGGQDGNAALSHSARMTAAGRLPIDFVADAYTVNGTGKYQGFADVTNLVRSAGSGTVTVGNVELATGAYTYGGWSLIVVTSDASMPVRSFAIFDGMASVIARASASATLARSPSAVGFTGDITAVTYDGERGPSGDALEVNGQAIACPGHAMNDFANSSIGSTQRVPADANTFGFDISTTPFAVASPIAKVTAAIRSPLDDIAVGVLVIAVDEH